MSKKNEARPASGKKKEEAMKATGYHLSVRMAFIRTDFVAEQMREEVNFWNEEPAIFQNKNGDVDGFEQKSLEIFEFDDSCAVSMDKEPALSVWLKDAGDEVGSKAQEFLKKGWIGNGKLTAALAKVIQGYWDQGYKDFLGDTLANLDEDDFEWRAARNEDSIEAEEDEFAGAVLLEMTKTKDVPATVKEGGIVEVDEEFDWEDHRDERCMLVIKPMFKFGLKAAKG